VTDQEIIDALMKAAVYCSGMDLANHGKTFSAAAERIRVLGEKNTALLAVAEAAREATRWDGAIDVEQKSYDDLKAALDRLDGEVG
jgi:uncharacterized protein with HEPN domain